MTAKKLGYMINNIHVANGVAIGPNDFVDYIIFYFARYNLAKSPSISQYHDQNCETIYKATVLNTHHH